MLRKKASFLLGLFSPLRVIWQMRDTSHYFSWEAWIPVLCFDQKIKQHSYKILLEIFFFSPLLRNSLIIEQLGFV